jgi:hypothetical protein
MRGRIAVHARHPCFLDIPDRSRGRDGAAHERTAVARDLTLLSVDQLGKARELGRQVGAGAGIAMDFRRGRMVVDILDTIVRDGFYVDDDLLAEWRSAKRVRGVPGGAGAAPSAGGAQEVAPLKLVTGAEDSANAMSA